MAHIRRSGTFLVESLSISKSVAMANPQTAIPVSVLYLDDEEPEDEDACKNISTSGESRTPMAKPPLLQLSVAADAGISIEDSTNAELVYPWLQHTGSSPVRVTTESSVMLPMTLYEPVVHSEPSSWVREGVTTALLTSRPQNSTSNVRCGVESPLGYGTNIEMQHRHSILRMSASKTSSSHGLRKSVSVEFEFDHVHQRAAQSIYASTSSLGREPRCVVVDC